MWKFVLASLTLVFVANCRGDDDSPAPATDIKSGTSSTLWSYQEKYPSVMATGSLERGEALTRVETVIRKRKRHTRPNARRKRRRRAASEAQPQVANGPDQLHKPRFLKTGDPINT